MSAYDALRQFDDNTTNYADTPEKENLYKGLSNMAAELQRLSAATARIESELQQIERKIGR